MELDDYPATEELADAAFRRFLVDNRQLLRHITKWGDGRCGHMLVVMQEVLLDPEPPRIQKPIKKTISHSLRMRVFERDAYRCKHCGTHLQLTCDHVVAEINGGETTYDNLQTLCKTCNCKKGTK